MKPLASNKKAILGFLFLSPFFLLLLLHSIAFGKGRFGETLCQQEPYTCLEIKKDDSWKTLFADEAKRDLVRRINRINIRLRPGMKIAAPKDWESFKAETASPFPAKIEPLGKKEIRADLSQLAWGAYDAEGKLLKWGPLSAGKGWCPDTKIHCRTPVGTFSVQRKMGAGCKSNKFPIPRGGAPMPYCMFFRGGFAVHGSYDVPGYHASHGCVRIFPEDAKWLNEQFVEFPSAKNSYQNTSVLILPYAPVSSEEAVKRR